jgi:hypothetical protein
MSAYWTPAIYHIKPNNTLVNLKVNLTEVQWSSTTEDAETLSEMPDGLRKLLLGIGGMGSLIAPHIPGITAGSSTRRHTNDLLKEHIMFVCVGAGGMEYMPHGCPNLKTIIEFPSCVSESRFHHGSVL